MDQIKNVDSYLDNLLGNFSATRCIKYAQQLVSTKSQKIFEELDSRQLFINQNQQHLDISFRSQTAQISIPTRKIDCFGQIEVKTFTKEEIDSLRKERGQRAQLKIRQIQEVQEKRKQDFLESWKKTQQIQHQKPLFQILQEQENAQIKLQQEIIQQKLEQIKQERKPLNKIDFEEHRKKFCDLIIQPRKKSIEQQFNNQTKSISPEKSTYYLKIEQEQNKLKLLEQERKNHQMELQNKKKNFSEETKKRFKPKLSLDKQNELLEIQSKLNHKSDFQKYQVLANKVRQKKISYQIQDTDEDAQSLINFIKNKDQNTSYDLASQDTQLPKFKHKSFVIETNTQQQNTNYWQKVALNNNLSIKDKNQLIIEEAKKLEELSKKQEQLARVTGNDSPQADNLLISSIKAKLTVLQN
ncbi:unnamed protein product [Paramecium pentaurelia]|uniref:Uncharacterized protein n=1 Tax=Paramecium pentaurelia TaxID=43138 RepID=A0A8S1TKQ2_9CILI|nr:unnamed protein product [Paramecium pentaurelia]